MTEQDEIMRDYRNMQAIYTSPDKTWRFDVEKRRFIPNQDRPIMSYEQAMAAPLEYHSKVNANGELREFDTGATRDTEEGKLDYEGFLSPLVLERYAEYMHKNRVQSDGSLRSADNWQKGIPTDVYMKSMWRHFMDLWMLHRGIDFNAKNEELPAIDEALCALLFNVMGYLYQILEDYDSDGMSRVSP